MCSEADDMSAPLNRDGEDQTLMAGDPFVTGELDFHDGERVTVTLDDLWAEMWEDVRHNATGKPSGAALIAKWRVVIEAAIRAERLTEAGSLDRAWAEAEAALPEGWRFGGVWPIKPTGWEAEARDEATVRPLAQGRRGNHRGTGPTPTAALQALTAKLREKP